MIIFFCYNLQGQLDAKSKQLESTSNQLKKAKKNLEEFDGSELTIGMDLGHFKKELTFEFFFKNKFVPEFYKICIYSLQEIRTIPAANLFL